MNNASKLLLTVAVDCVLALGATAATSTSEPASTSSEPAVTQTPSRRVLRNGNIGRSAVRRLQPVGVRTTRNVNHTVASTSTRPKRGQRADDRIAPLTDSVWQSDHSTMTHAQISKLKAKLTKMEFSGDFGHRAFTQDQALTGNPNFQ